jgi:hypothetical protein
VPVAQALEEVVAMLQPVLHVLFGEVLPLLADANDQHGVGGGHGVLLVYLQACFHSRRPGAVRVEVGQGQADTAALAAPCRGRLGLSLQP